MRIGIPKESFPGERRVALVPAMVQRLTKAGHEVLVEAGAGSAAGFRDQEYRARGAQVEAERTRVFSAPDIIVLVRALGANPERGAADLETMHAGQILVATIDPLGTCPLNRQAAKAGITLFALELVPRITRAQSMDVLSSMATVAGYKAVLLAANALNRMFPMMMTAAGTITPAKVLVLGAGVAGLQAIATARRNGAVVYGYDIRPAVKEQVQSLGARFLELKLEAEDAQDKGGYAKEMGEDFLRQQRELLTEAAAGSDVIITTAAIPGKKAPILIPKSMVEAMLPGSVIVDLAAEHGGNCELTSPGQTVEHHGVLILGPENLPSSLPYHASEMFAKNATAFILNLFKQENPEPDLEDEIVARSLVARKGELLHERVRAAFGLESLAKPALDPAGTEGGKSS